MSSQYLRIFQQPRSAILLILGFASGLPLALTSGTLQAWMTVENIDLKTIGFFSLVGQAYVFKFLWSPLMDRYTPPFLGRRRGWLLATQLLLLAAIAAMGFLEPGTQLRWMAALAVVIAFCSASQDIVFDAWKTDVLPAEERGAGAAISVLGYRLGMLVSGGLALWLILLLIVLYKLGDAFAMSLTTTFLIRGVGFDAGEVGVVNKTLGLLATIVGALYGGILMQRLSLFRALLIFGILQGASNAGYWLLSITDKNMFSMGAAVFFENLCGGMGTAAFVALLMTLCNKSFSATQFALLSALSAVGRVYVGPVAGWFVEAHGWPTFYLFSVVAAVPGLLLLLVCRQTLEYSWQNERFIPRTQYRGAYNFALSILLAGVALLAVWVLLLTMNALDYTNFSFLSGLLETAVAVAVCGIVFGGLLDYLALRKTRLL
ncbi:MFS transporter [Salmonella enterica]|uniref:MFS transporter n=1 Tax=Salmonella enterica TaxID=28901 RepID=UPI0038B40623